MYHILSLDLKGWAKAEEVKKGWAKAEEVKKGT